MTAHLGSERYKSDPHFREVCAAKLGLGIASEREEQNVTARGVGNLTAAIRIPIDGEDHPTTQALRQEQAKDAERSAAELVNEIENMPAEVRQRVGL
jgi:hypothetical protein